MGVITRFDAGVSPLARISDMKSFVMDYYDDTGGSGQGAVVELIHTHPVIMLQLGLLALCFFNTVMQTMMPLKFAAAMRKQSIMLALVSASLDVFTHMNVIAGTGDDRGSSSASAKSAGAGGGNPLANLLKGIAPNMPLPPNLQQQPPDAEEAGTINNASSGKQGNDGDDATPEVMDADYLKRARADMTNLAKGRLGQILGFTVISLMCGSLKHCMLPILIRNAPFLARGLLLVLAMLVPDIALPIVMYSQNHAAAAAASTAEEGGEKRHRNEKKSKKNKNKSKKGYRQESRGKLEVGGVSISSLLFPADMCAPGGDILQDVCDLAAWPVEQMILSKWMKELIGGVFGSGTTASKKLFGIPVGGKGKAASPPPPNNNKGVPKMGKHATKQAPATPTADAAPKPSVNIFQIGAFASKALFIHNYQRLRSRSISQLQSLPRVVRMLNIPGGEALLARMNKEEPPADAAAGSESGVEQEQEEDGAMDAASEGNSAPVVEEAEDKSDDGGGDGGFVMNAKTTHSDVSIPVTADIKITKPSAAVKPKGKGKGKGKKGSKKSKAKGNSPSSDDFAI
jgi:hypothetical protein